MGWVESMTEIVVTAGPTREYLDGVRYIANGSSGRMGFAIASAAVAQGHSVTLVLGPTELEPPAGVRVQRVTSACEMHDAALAAFEGADVAFGVAAVADFRPAHRHPGKPSKAEVGTTIELVPNPDVIAALGAVKGGRTVVGFALEVDDPPGSAVGKARAKLTKKHLDVCVLNDVAAMGAEGNQVTLVWADGRVESLPRASKEEIGAELVRRVVGAGGAATRRPPVDGQGQDEERAP